jgi:hypothetical protein
MNKSKAGKLLLVIFIMYVSAMGNLNIPRGANPPFAMPFWVFLLILLMAWLLEGVKSDILQIRRTNICLSPSGALIPFVISLFLGLQSMYAMPFAIGLLIMSGLMFKLSKPDFLKGSVRFKPEYALALSYFIAALAALLMYGTTDFAFNIRVLAPLAGAIGTTGILIGNIATGLELSSQKSTPATFKQKIILGGNGIRDILWVPLFIAMLLFTVPTILAEFNFIPPILQQYFT